MPALFPSQVAPEFFRVGDCVRKFISEWNVTPYLGVVTQIVPSTYKVWVQWPMANSQEDPETLIKVNPAIYGMPVTLQDKGYSSYEKSVSNRRFGLPVLASARDTMAIRIAHNFATDVIGKLVDDVARYQGQGLSEVQAYNRIYEKYGSYCSDHIMKNTIRKVYSYVHP